MLHDPVAQVNDAKQTDRECLRCNHRKVQWCCEHVRIGHRDLHRVTLPTDLAIARQVPLLDDEPIEHRLDPWQ